MDIIFIDEEKKLILSSDIDDWDFIDKENIKVIIDVDGGLDIGISTIPNNILYVYFPFVDDDLPDIERLRIIGKFCAELYVKGYKILVHCAMGYNRSALVIAMILVNLGYSGKSAIELIREKRKGALYNPKFYDFINSL